MKSNSELIQHLQERRLIKESEGNMELSHDILAALIAKKQESMLEIKGLIRYAYRGYLDNKTYLNPRQLLQIEPYLNRLLLDPEEKDFIQASRDYNRKKRFRNVVLVGAIVLVLLSLSISSFLLWQNALSTQIRFLDAQYQKFIEKAQQQTEKANYADAIDAYQDALEILRANKRMSRDSISILADIQNCEQKLADIPNFKKKLQKADAILAKGDYKSLLQADTILDQAWKMDIDSASVFEKRNAWLNRRTMLLRDYTQRQTRLLEAQKAEYAQEIQKRINQLKYIHPE